MLLYQIMRIHLAEHIASLHLPGTPGDSGSTDW